MKSLVPIVATAMVPFIVLILVVGGVGLGLVQWHPPETWSIDFGTLSAANGITAVSGDTTGLYTTGFVGLTEFNQLNVTPSQLFVSRYDFNGLQIWTRAFASPNISQINAVDVEQGGVYIAGGLNNTSFVKRYDLGGNQVWNSSFGSGTTAAVALSVATNGVYVGYYQGMNSFLRDYNSSGGVLWTDPLGNYTGSLSIFADSSGTYVLDAESGNSLIRMYDPNGSLLWNHVCSCQAFGNDGISGDSNGIYAVGLAPYYYQDIMARYDLKGNQVWTTKVTAPDGSTVGGFEITSDSSGAYLTLATGAGHSYLLKFDQSGNLNWSFAIPAHISTQSSGIPLFAGENGLFVGGSVNKTPPTVDAYLAQFLKSSSLIFFGLNPPWSFATVGTLATFGAFGIFFFIRLRKQRVQPKRSGLRFKSSYSKQ